MERRKENREWVYVLIGIICIIITVVAIILFLLQGNTKTVSRGEVEISESVTCEGKGIVYPIFKYDGSKEKSIKINVLFDGEKLEKISLVYQLKYDDSKQIEQSSAENHAAMNKSFEADSLGADALGVRYSNLSDAMQMTLYAEAKALNGVTAKYFLLDGLNSYTKENITKKYNNQGLDCVIKNKS